LARLKIYGQGNVEVEFVTAYLADLAHAYNSVFALQVALDGMNRAANEWPFGWRLGVYAVWPLPSNRGKLRLRDWPPTADEAASMVPLSEQLILLSVRLESPGFWEFAGSLNPLEVVRRYLNDRHERRKDREYRESAEQRRLSLENLALESRVISDRVRLAKELGAKDSDLAPILKNFLYRPLVALDPHQDRGLVDNAELSEGDGDRSEE
jgi:hypothetical protein